MRNRIAQPTDRISDLIPSIAAASVATSARASASSMVMVPLLGTQPGWQAELYRRAYEKAVADLAPPRHMLRFFSVWN